MAYKFIFEEKEYELGDKNLENIYNDENNPVENIDLNIILEMLNNSEEVRFEKAYYDETCSKCLESIEKKKNFFEFLEYYFYIYTKNNKFVISNICDEYKGLTFNKLFKNKKVDHSYIVTISVCSNCGEYFINIEEFEV